MLQATGVLKGAAPNKDDWEMHHTGAVWGELDMCRGQISLDGLVVGDTVYLGPDADGAKQEVAKMILDHSAITACDYPIYTPRVLKPPINTN